MLKNTLANFCQKNKHNKKKFQWIICNFPGKNS